MDAKQTRIRQLLAEFVMFSALSDEEKAALTPLFGIAEYDAGETLCLQNTPMTHWFYLHSGGVRLKKNDADKRRSVGELRKDASFGERCLIDEDIWPSDVVATEAVTALTLAGEQVRELQARFPGIREIFRSRLGVVELSHRLRGILGDNVYSHEDFEMILANVGVKNVARGKAVFRQGQEDPRLYCVEKGAVELVRAPLSGDEVILDRLYRGDLLGETCALPPPDGSDTQHHSAIALTDDVSVLVIRQEAVGKILQINPELHESLRLRVRELQQNEVNEIAVRQRAEGMDQRIRLADAVTEEEFLAMEKKQDAKRFGVVRQNQEEDCAAACLTMVCRHYGKDFSMGQIRELANLSVANPVPSTIIGGAERMGFSSRAYALKFEDIQTVKLPAVVGWEDYHYVVIYRITKKDVYLADPATGLRKLSKAEFLTGWTQANVKGVPPDPERGVLIALDPTQRFEQQAVPKKPILHFINYILPYKRFFVEAMIAALTINLLGLASPLFVQTIVDNVVVHNDASLLNMMLAGMVLVSVFSTLAGIAQNLLLAHTTARIDMRMMSEFYRHVLSLPMNFFLTRNKGEILARFGENQKIRAIISGSTVTVLLNTLMIVVYFLMMFGYSVSLTIAFMIFIPMYLGIIFYFTPRIKKISQEIFETNSQSQSRLIESLNGIETLKATGNEYMARANWENAFVDNVNRSFRSAKLNLMSNSLNKLVSLSSQVAILWLGAHQVMEGSLSVGELMGFNMLTGMVIGPILQMVGLWNSLLEVRISVDRVGEILSVDPEQAPVTSANSIPASLTDCQGRIEFRHANFSYTANEQENFVMRDFNLTIEPGQRVAFVGASGCGKSTIAKMVLGFNMPASGECLIDGKEIRDIDLTSLRRNIGVVLQDSFIMAGTVAENIALGDPQPDLAAVTEAARLAGAHEFIINYPVGYQTLIGEKGMGISGGQRQRICIARALYRKPKILIFDEATSALDNESEKRIQENMQTILRGRTSITIAHRLSTIVDSDMICFIANGQVAEKGTHEELTNRDYLETHGYEGLYYRLAQPQFNLPPLNIE
ncbi:peptidase domain-containing ABC transporter [Granulosicoccaceae sp. 1_MG-2023]|nr:peptidase domain-containing ABC transporter [Granulosicoccaceae sp. 1_MG-2023]